MSNELLEGARGPLDKARLKAICAPLMGNWLLVPPITAVRFRISNEMIGVTTGLRLDTKLCEIHDCPCDKIMECWGTHGLSCRRSAGRVLRHNAMNDVIWPGMRHAKIPASKEPVGLLRNDGKHPDSATLIPWKQEKYLAWDITMPETGISSRFVGTLQDA